MERKNKGYIYLITCIVNGKHYVGQTRKYRYNNTIKLGVKGRYNQHIYNAINYRDDCPKLNRAIRKYGAENFMVAQLRSCSLDELNDLETYYIQLFNSVIEGYNCSEGGDYPQFSEEQRKKMNESISAKAKKRWSNDEYRKNVSQKVRVTAAKNAMKIKTTKYLPTNIVEMKNKGVLIGYAVKISINGVVNWKCFSSSQITLEEKLSKAKAHLAEILESLE